MKDTPISEEVALSILFSVVEDFSKKVEKLLKVPVNQNQFDALVDFSYNLGIGNFQKSTLLKLVNNKDFIGIQIPYIFYTSEFFNNFKFKQKFILKINNMTFTC